MEREALFSSKMLFWTEIPGVIVLWSLSFLEQSGSFCQNQGQSSHVVLPPACLGLLWRFLCPSQLLTLLSATLRDRSVGELVLGSRALKASPLPPNHLFPWWGSALP